MMDALKVILDQNGIDYNEKRFNSDTGLKDLGPNPFVRELLLYARLLKS